jgi:hypothetical protein
MYCRKDERGSSLQRSWIQRWEERLSSGSVAPAPGDPSEHLRDPRRRVTRSSQGEYQAAVQALAASERRPRTRSAPKRAVPPRACAPVARFLLNTTLNEPAAGPSESQLLRAMQGPPHTRPLSAEESRRHLKQRQKLSRVLEIERGPRPVPTNVPRLRERQAIRAYQRTVPADWLEYARAADKRENYRLFIAVDWNAKRNHLREERRRVCKVDVSLLELFNCETHADIEALCESRGVTEAQRETMIGWWQFERNRIDRKLDHRTYTGLFECPHCQRFFHA